MFSILLGVAQLQNDNDDCLQWRWSNDLNFSVHSAYSSWENIRFVEDKTLFSVWRNICPPKTELFTWMAIQNSIVSRSVLVSRGILPNQLDLCPFCNQVSETPNHFITSVRFFLENLVYYIYVVENVVGKP